jgi:DNA-binding NarL/FixJ family response regulator
MPNKRNNDALPQRAHPGNDDRLAADKAKARVIILSDVRLYREGLLWRLERRGDFEVLGAADFSRAAMEQVIELWPDVIILDIGGPEALALAKMLRISIPAARIIAFAVSESDHFVVACAEAGINGYVAPDGSEEDLAAAIEHALRGELYCSPRVAGALLRRVAASSTESQRPSEQMSLTEREHQILGLVNEGLSNKEIGRALRIGDSTVKNHVHNILDKLQVHRRGEAAVRLRAIRTASQSGVFERRR